MNRPPRAPDAPERHSRYEVPSAAQLALGLWVRGVGYNRAVDPQKYCRKRRLESYAAVYVSRGQGWFESAPTGRVEVRAGTLFWLFPDVVHSYGATGSWAEQWVIFGGSTAQAFERQGYLTPAKPFVRVGNDPEIVSLFARLQDTAQLSGPLMVSLAAALTHQLIVVVHGISTGFFGREGTVDPAIAEALRIIEREATQGLPPEALAARLHVGYSTLRRRFKSQTGYSVKEYLLRVKLKHAKELLAFTSNSIEKVAAEAGFEDSFYFSRIFKAREGVPPSVFREQQPRR